MYTPKETGELISLIGSIVTIVSAGIALLGPLIYLLEVPLVFITAIAMSLLGIVVGTSRLSKQNRQVSFMRIARGRLLIFLWALFSMWVLAVLADPRQFQGSPNIINSIHDFFSTRPGLYLHLALFALAVFFVSFSFFTFYKAFQIITTIQADAPNPSVETLVAENLEVKEMTIQNATITKGNISS